MESIIQCLVSLADDWLMMRIAAGFSTEFFHFRMSKKIGAGTLFVVQSTLRTSALVYFVVGARFRLASGLWPPTMVC